MTRGKEQSFGGDCWVSWVGHRKALRLASGALAAVLLLAGGRLQAAKPQEAFVEAPAAWVNDLQAIGAAEWNADRAAHLLERAGFGGTPDEVAKLAAMSPQQAVDYLVDYESLPTDDLPAFEHSGIYPNGHKVQPLEKIVGPGLMTGKVFGIKAMDSSSKLLFQPAVNEFYTLLVSEHTEMRRAGPWWAERMLLTPRPFEEKMTLFWHDHFATSQEKVLRYQKMLAQIETLRRHANGNFRELLIAVAQDPAMLIWLDNKDNVKGKPNENFAREIMELFCMGEGRGYTEADIREMARAFTGWTMTPDETVEDEGKFLDNPKLHDDGNKSFLGGSGNFDGYQAIDIILQQPATSRFLSGKIYRYFVREDLSGEVNDALAKLLVDTKYDLKPLLKTLFLSRDFYSQASVGTQIKGPVHLVVSTYRKLGLKRVPGIPDFTDTTETLGQVLFFPPNVAGWTDGKAWVNPSTLLARGNFVHALLFADLSSYGAPDKEIVESYRKIPLAFPEYNIVPHLWNATTGHMEPVSTDEYRQHLAALGDTGLDAGYANNVKQNVAGLAGGTASQMPKEGAGGASRMSKLSNSEKFNLAVGVYTGFVRAYERTKAIPRTPIELRLSELVSAVGAQTSEEVVDHFCRRFLRVPLYGEERTVIIEFLRRELGSDRLDAANPRQEEALRRTLHLILSSPEYQLG